MRRKRASKSEIDGNNDGSEAGSAKGLSNKSKKELIGLLESLTEENFDLKNKLTEKKLYLEHLQPLGSVLEGSTFEVLIIGTNDFSIIHINKMGIEKLNYSPKELRNLTLFDITREFDEEIYSQTPFGNGEVILVVDDESMITDMMKSILEEFDYKVLVAHDGREAVSTFLQHKDEVSAAIVETILI